MLAPFDRDRAHRRARIHSKEGRLAIDFGPDQKVILAGTFQRQRLENRILELGREPGAIRSEGRSDPQSGGDG